MDHIVGKRTLRGSVRRYRYDILTIYLFEHVSLLFGTRSRNHRATAKSYVDALGEHVEEFVPAFHPSGPLH